MPLPLAPCLSLCALLDTLGAGAGSIEGRVAVQHVEESAAGRNFTFKCHRDSTDIYSVNAIAFHPQVLGLGACGGCSGAVGFGGLVEGLGFRVGVQGWRVCLGKPGPVVGICPRSMTASNSSPSPAVFLGFVSKAMQSRETLGGWGC